MSEQTQDQQQNQDKALSAPVRVERDQGPVGLVVLNRPEQRNALDLAMRRGYCQRFSRTVGMIPSYTRHRGHRRR